VERILWVSGYDHPVDVPNVIRLGLDRLSEALGEADAGVAASSRGLLIRPETLAGAGPLHLVDLGMPRNVHPEVRGLAGVVLEDLQDLARFVRTEAIRAPSGRIPRGAASAGDLPAWQQILQEGLREFRAWLSARTPSPGPPAGPARRSPRVFLVGAGPGDPELLTRRAHRLLREADVVFVDALVPPGIVELIPEGVRRVPVGGRRGRRRCPKEAAHRAMAQWAHRGALVVHLKSGDPLLFAGAAEEIGALEAAGVAVEVVPGITAASAAAASLGLPLTRRGDVSTVMLLSGHERPGPWAEELATRLAKALADGATIALYMAGRTGPALARHLLAAGLNPDTPVAVVSRASQPDAVHRHLTVSALAVAEPGDIVLPAVILLSPILGEAGPSSREEVETTQRANV
jgi:uroporphyrin-III C-methyltransferase